VGVKVFLAGRLGLIGVMAFGTDSLGFTGRDAALISARSLGVENL